MSKETRNVGLAFLFSILIVAAVATAAHILAGTLSPVVQTACFKTYTLACAF